MPLFPIKCRLGHAILNFQCQSTLHSHSHKVELMTDLRISGVVLHIFSSFRDMTNFNNIEMLKNKAFKPNFFIENSAIGNLLIQTYTLSVIYPRKLNFKQ